MIISSGSLAAQGENESFAAEDYFKRGLGKIKSEGCGSAVPDFDRAIELQPDFAAVYAGRGRAYFDEFRPDKATAAEAQKALNDFNQTVRLNPQNAEFYYSRAKLYFHSVESN